MNTVLNLKNIDTTKEPIFLGESLSLQRYDRFKYPIFFQLFKDQEGFRWWPHEIDLQKDRADYKKLTDTERFIFDTNLRFQTLGDSMLSRSIHSLAEYVSNPELEACMNTWASIETIHSYSYSYLLNNVYSDATKFFDSIMEDKEILYRANLIRNNYDRILGDPKDIKQKIFDAVLATNVMEGLVFYISFACSFYFGYRGIMEGNAKIIRFISRDENLHVAITQNVMKILASEKDEGFQDVVKNSEQKVYEMYNQAVKDESQWADYLFQNGSLIGLTKESLIKYAKWIADNRLTSLGYKKIFNEPSNPLSGWLNSFMDSKKVQNAPQETNLSAYKISSRDTSINQKELEGIEL